MSLDITLRSRDKIEKNCGHCGSTYEEYATYFDTNITHNLGAMADAAGIYEALWRPHRLKPYHDIPEDSHRAEAEFERKTITIAKELIEIIENGLADLKARPEYFRQFDAKNHWGTYDDFVPWVEDYLYALKEYPEAEVIISR